MLIHKSSPPESRDFDGFDSNLHASLSGVPNLMVPGIVQSKRDASHLNISDQDYQSGNASTFQTSRALRSSSPSPCPFLGLKVDSYLSCSECYERVLTQ